MDASEMYAMQYREENGHLPDEVLVLTDEDDPWDPEQAEILSLVQEQYAHTNAQRRAERDRIRISVLEQTLREHGIEIPE